MLEDKQIPRECELIIYRTILKPILTYGSEMWALTSKLQAAEIRVSRLFKGVTRIGIENETLQ